MPIEYKQPKLKDKLYGEMIWEDFDEYESFWYAPMEIATGERFDLLICAEVPTNFLAVAGTHAVYRQITAQLDAICDEMIGDILKNSLLLKKRRQRHSAGSVFKKNLRLFSIKISEDLSSEVSFVEKVGEDEEPDESFYALLNENCELIKAGIDEL